MKKRIFSVILSLVLCIVGIPCTVSATIIGEGTSTSPYLISSEDDLFELGAYVGAGVTYEGVYWALASDITLTKEWTPIGTADYSFCGIFNGNGHTISGLTASGDYIGLFGYVGNGAVLKNITLSEISMSGQNYVAGVVAYVDAGTGSVEISNCSISGILTGEKKDDDGDYMGKYTSGIAAYVNASNGTVTIQGCSTYGTIKGQTYIGGMVGYGKSSNSNLKIIDCTNSAYIPSDDNSNYCGGIAGTISGAALSNCLNYGSIYGNSASEDNGSSFLGGITGEATSCSFTNCGNFGNISTFFAGGISSTGGNSTYTNCLNAGTFVHSSDGYGVGIAKKYDNTFLNCYSIKCEYSSAFNQGGIFGDTEYISTEQLASGEVCYLLNENGTNDTWRQSIGTDNYPSFSGEVVYKNGDSYSNSIDNTEDNEIIASGICGADGDNLTWVLTDDGTLTISGTWEMADYPIERLDDRVAPWSEYYDQIKTLIITSGVTSVGDWAFYDCLNIENVDFPDTLTIIGESSFYGCSSISELTIPSSITIMGEGAFCGIHNITTINISDIEAWCNITHGGQWLNHQQGLGYELYLNNILVTEVNIPETITKIDSWTFMNCKSITCVNLNDNVSIIEKGAFSECSKLTKIVVSDKVTYIGDSAFFMCFALSDVTLGNSLTQIGESSFAECTSLNNLFIPKSIKGIDFYAFIGCNSLNSITFEGNAPIIDNEAFMDVSTTVYYPADNPTWTSDIVQNYGGNLTWEAVGASYSATLSTLSYEVEKGESISINLNATHNTDTTYAASKIVLTYDSDKLSFNESASTLGNATVKDENGTLTLQDYGESKNLGNGIYTLSFDTIASGEATVTLISASFVNKENAAQSDLIEATLSSDTVNLTIQNPSFHVTLPDIFTGSATVTEGENYTFSQADSANYDYTSVSATMDGQSIQVTDNGDGTYTIENVTGDLVISGTRTEKTYNVVFTGNGAADIQDGKDTATYNQNYSFTMPTASGWTYRLVSITMGGTAYTGYSVMDSVYTIPGTAIHGEIVITIEKTYTQANVTVEGSGAGAAVGYDTTVTPGTDYTLTITPEAGYSYIVTAYVDGHEVPVIDNGDNTYTVENVDGNLTFYVERVVIVSGVSVSKYITLDGSTMWLVKNETTLETGKVPTYDGQKMFWSEEYTAYCYLVIAPTLYLEEVTQKVDIIAGTPAMVNYETMDINLTGKVDASDAQLIYNMYNADYSAFTAEITMEKFLRADVNGDGIVNLEDAAAIISKILH